MDAQHLSGNSDVYAGLSFDRFYLLGNYKAYSTDYFLEGHFEHNLEGFLLNKVPLLRQLKLRETLGVNYLYTERMQHYWELLIGEIGRAHVCTPVTNAHLVCRLSLEKR